MKKFSFTALGVLFAAIFVVSVSAQTGAAQPGAGKVGLVNTFAFADEKAGGGITKFKNALNALETEFKSANDELKSKATRYQTLLDQIDKERKAAGTVPVNQQALQVKIDEAQGLEVQIKRLQEDGKAKYEKRYSAVVGPIFADIIKAMNEFAKKNGYAVILDGAKLEQADLLLGFDDKYDVTKDFIAFYNARPAGTATTTAPK